MPIEINSLEAAAERLKKIAAQTWVRHFDDRIGLSNEELVRYQREPAADLPVVEMLLDEESPHLAGLSEFIGKPISLSTEPSLSAEHYDIVLL